MTTEELLKLKTDYAAWFVPGDEIDLSEVADDVTKLVDELLVTRGNLAAVTAQLAERSLVAEQLSMALNVRDTPLATITAERDAAVSALRLTRAAQGQHTGVFMRLDAYEDLLSQIAALEEQVKALRVQVSARG